MSDVVRAKKNLVLGHPETGMPVRVSRGDVVPEELWPAIGSLRSVYGVLPHLVDDDSDVDALFLDFPDSGTMEKVTEWIMEAEGDSYVDGLRARLARARHSLEFETSPGGKNRPTLTELLGDMVEGLTRELVDAPEVDAPEVGE